MSPATETRVYTVALIGNPNTGKSTLFTGLVGIRQHVGNYPGVTVEKKTGRLQFAGRQFELIDLPGLYSLAPRSRDEMVAVDLLLGRREDTPPVDAVLCIVDASNLRRNLYLVSQVIELGLPTVVAVNMLDVAEDHSVKVDVERLSHHLGVPAVPVQANRRIGLSQLKTVLASTIKKAGNQETEDGTKQNPCTTPLPAAFESEVSLLEAELADDPAAHDAKPLPRCLVQRLLLDVSGYLQRTLLNDTDGHWERRLADAQARLANAGHPVPSVETAARYDWARHVLDDVLVEPGRYKVTMSDRIDRVLTHRLWGSLAFAVVMLVMFQAVFVGARPAMDAIQAATATAGGWIESHMAEGALRSLIVGGVLGGVGGVVGFLPQILVLFACLAVLEDCGYMARAAYLMDRVMVRVGLSGKAFIPLLSSFACAVPGIMATRVIENSATG